MSNQNRPSPTPESESDPETLYRDHADWLASALRRRFGADIAEDLVQETYLRLVAQSQRTRVAKPRNLLLRIASNLMIDGWRREARGPRLQPLETEWIVPGSSGSQLETLLLKEVILSMPDALRSVFLLNRFSGLTYQDIAEDLNISVKTVEWRMSRALAFCAERLRD